MTTLDDLKKQMTARNSKRAAVARIKHQERKSWYFSPFYLPKDERNVCDHADGQMIDQAFESHQHEVALEILGTLCNLKRIGGGGQEGGTIGPDHQGAIDLIRTWYLKAKAYDAVMEEPNT